MGTYPRKGRPYVKWGEAKTADLGGFMGDLVVSLEASWRQRRDEIAAQLVDDGAPCSYGRMVLALCEAAADVAAGSAVEKIDLPFYKEIAHQRDKLALAIALELIHYWESGLDETDSNVDPRARERQVDLYFDPKPTTTTILNHLLAGRGSRASWMAKRAKEPRPSVISSAATDAVRFGRHLAPPPSFRGREALLDELELWARSPDDPHRVLALVSIGGAGKSALVWKLTNERLRTWVPNGRVFVWSYGGDEPIDEMARAAVEWFTGEAPPTSIALYHLSQALATPRPHLLVLDGLEWLQKSQPRGELVAPELTTLLRLIAGAPGRAKILVTSRYPLVDLGGYKGLRTIGELDIERGAAAEVLRDHCVIGEEDVLEAVVDAVGGHPLSLEIAGSYLREFHGGDARRFKDEPLNLDRYSADSPAANRLLMILDRYRSMLSDSERATLGVLSAFTSPVRFATLAAVGAHAELRTILTRLRKLQLVAESGDPRAFAIRHGFVRDYFRQKEGGDQPSLHRAIFNVLSLTERADVVATSSAERDECERWISHAIAAEDLGAARSLYLDRLGGLPTLCWRLADYGRGARVMRLFRPLDIPDRRWAAHDLGWYTSLMGELETACQCFLTAAFDSDDALRATRELGLLGEHEFLRGRYAIAATLIDQARRNSHGFTDPGLAIVLAAAYHRMERDDEAATLFNEAGGSTSDASFSYGFFHAEFVANTGRPLDARQMLDSQIEHFERLGWTSHLVRCYALRGHCALALGDVAEATACLTRAHEHLGTSGYKHGGLRAQYLAASIALAEARHDDAVRFSSDGLLDASTHGFSGLAIDFQLLRAEILATQGHVELARRGADEACRQAKLPDRWYLAALKRAVPLRRPDSPAPKPRLSSVDQQLRALLIKHFPVSASELDGTGSAREHLGMDSLADAELIVEIEAHFGFEFPDEETPQLVELTYRPVKEAIAGLVARIEAHQIGG